MRTSQNALLELMRRYQVHRPRRHNLIRIGRNCDGGYVACDDTYNTDIAVSIGIGGDVSFDLQLASRGIVVHQFDHTVDAPPTHHPRFYFNKQKWTEVGQEQGVRLGEINKTLGCASKRSLLKFDVEGCEWDNLCALLPHDLFCYRQIICEVHGLSSLYEMAFFEKVKEATNRLLHSHIPIHAHVNNYGTLALIEGVVIPDVIEVSLLRRDLDDFAAYSGPLPCPLDFPNCPDRPDYYFPYSY
jgi:hypothetical protein